MAGKGNGLYKTKLTGDLASLYKRASQQGLGDLNQELVYLVHARLAMTLGDRLPASLSSTDKKLLEAAKILADSGHDGFTDGYIERLKQMLLGLTDEKLTNLAVQLSKVQQSISSEAEKRLRICQGVFEKILVLHHKESTEIILLALQEMLTEAGLDIATHDKIIAKALQETEALTQESLAQQDLTQQSEQLNNVVQLDLLDLIN
jgi:hypothetical protein